MVLEHIDLYTGTGEGPTDDWDYCIPVGKAAVRRVGSAVTVLSYLAMTGYVLDAAEATGVDAEVIDLRWLDRASIDWETIGQSTVSYTHLDVYKRQPLGYRQEDLISPGWGGPGVPSTELAERRG